MVLPLGPGSSAEHPGVWASSADVSQPRAWVHSLDPTAQVASKVLWPVSWLSNQQQNNLLNRVQLSFKEVTLIIATERLSVPMNNGRANL